MENPRGGEVTKARTVSVMKESGRPEFGKEWESSSGLTERSTLENSGTGNVMAGGNRCFPKDMFMSATLRWDSAMVLEILPTEADRVRETVTSVIISRDGVTDREPTFLPMGENTWASSRKDVNPEKDGFTGKTG